VTIHSIPQEATTDNSGIAKFENIEKGNHLILIAYGNFKGEQTINLTGDVKEFDLNVTVTVKEEKAKMSLETGIIIGIGGIIILGLIFFIIKRSKQS